MKKPLILFGAGGLGREIKTLVDALSEWKLIGFCDDGISPGESVAGITVLGGKQYLLDHEHEVNVIVSLGDPRIKYEIIKNLMTSAKIRFPTLIHPRAILGDDKTIHIGAGSVITAGCVLSTYISIGSHVLVNLNSTVGHDSAIGDYSSVMPGVNLAGHTTIGKCVLIGSGANVINRITVGDVAIVGSGAVVTKNVPAGATVVGVPAKEIKSYGK